MPEYVIKPFEIPSIPVKGSGAVFPVRRIYCIGRNYADHAIEMGHDPNREPPFFFQKNADSIRHSGAAFPYPAMSTDVHYEIELVVALKSGGTNIPVDKAMDHVYGFGVGLDMTRRDLQTEAKNLGRPWEVGKSFEASAPCTHLIPIDKTGPMANGAIWLKVNGEVKQKGDLNQMIWKTPEMIAVLSEYYELAAGDIIMSGTPAGVGPIKKGDVMLGHVDGLDDLEVKVV
ncbi:MAG: hypothetical protein RLZ98_1138 [Pseudomonadota bacterium]